MFLRDLHLLRDVEGAGAGAPPPATPEPPTVEQATTAVTTETPPEGDFPDLDFDSLNDILNPTSEPPPASEAPAAPAAPPASTDGPGVPPAQPVTQPQQEDPRVALLTQEVQTLRELMTRMVPQAPAAPASPAATSQPHRPFQAFTIPQDVATLLGSENPAERGAALGHVLAEVGNIFHQRVMEDMNQRFQTVVPAAITRHQEQNEIAQDFFGRFPKLNNPVFRPVVGQVAKELATAQGHAYRGWNNQFRDAVAAETVRRLSAAIGVQARRTANPPPAPPPAVSNGSATRGGTGGAPVVNPNSPEAISEMLGF